MQDEVRKVNVLAASECGDGAVVKLPDKSLESEYIYFLEGVSPLKVTGYV